MDRDQEGKLVVDKLRRGRSHKGGIRQSEQWRSCDGGRFKSDLTIDVANVPATVHGTLELKPVDDGCVNQVRLVVDCGIPFVVLISAPGEIGRQLRCLVAAERLRLSANCVGLESNARTPQ